MTNEEKLSSAIADLRKSMGMTQQEFASHIGKATPTVQRYEGRNPPLGLDITPFIEMAISAKRIDLARIFADEAIDAIPVPVLEFIPPRLDLSSTVIPSNDPTSLGDKSPGNVDNVSIPTGSLPEENKRWVEMLTGILQSGHEVAIDAVTKNLVAFDLLVRIDSTGEQGEATKSGPPKGPRDPKRFPRVQRAPGLGSDRDRKRQRDKPAS